MKQLLEQTQELKVVGEYARATMPAKEAAEYLGLSYWKLLEMVKAGLLPHVRIGTGKAGRVLLRKSSLDAWLSAQEQASIAKPEPETVGKIRRLK